MRRWWHVSWGSWGWEGVLHRFEYYDSSETPETSWLNGMQAPSGPRRSKYVTENKVDRADAVQQPSSDLCLTWAWDGRSNGPNSLVVKRIYFRVIPWVAATDCQCATGENNKPLGTEKAAVLGVVESTEIWWWQKKPKNFANSIFRDFETLEMGWSERSKYQDPFQSRLRYFSP